MYKHTVIYISPTGVISFPWFLCMKDTERYMLYIFIFYGIVFRPIR